MTTRTSPRGHDPAGDEPVGHDPEGNEPVGYEPVGGEPVGCEPVGDKSMQYRLCGIQTLTPCSAEGKAAGRKNKLY